MRILVLFALCLAGCAPVPEQCRPRAGSIEQMFAPEQSRACRAADHE